MANKKKVTTVTRTINLQELLVTRIVAYSAIFSVASLALLFIIKMVWVPVTVGVAMVHVPSVLASDASNSVTLNWTAPGDDEYIGQANRYTIKYSTSSITDDNWAHATTVSNPPSPKTAGSAETLLVTGLQPKTKYYFAIKTYDESNNVSPLSNIATKTTGCVVSWSCSAWSACRNGTQTRTCVDMNACGTTQGKPAESRTCTVTPPPCDEDWQCTSWSACTDGHETRTCTDKNGCGTTEDKPGVSRTCDQGGGEDQITMVQDTYVVAAIRGDGGPLVRVLDGNGKLISQFTAYEPSFRGGVNVAVGDTGRDGRDEIITGPGPGRSPLVRVWSYKGELIDEFMAYDGGFTGGVNVAVGNVDGVVGGEIITAPYSGGGPLIRTFAFRDGGWRSVIENLFAYSRNLRGGVSIMVANVNGMGRDELLTVPNINSGGPHVRMFTVVKGRYKEQILGFFPYSTAFRGGVSFGKADINGDRKIDILTAPMSRGGPHLRVYKWFSDGQIKIYNPGYFVFDPEFRGGISVAGGDFDFSGKDEWVAAVRSGDRCLVRIYSSNGTKLLKEFLAFPDTIRTGVNIATGKFFFPHAK